MSIIRSFKSLYPSITGESNIASNTQVGKIEIPHKVYANENAYNTEGYTRSGEFIENKVTDNIIEYCHRWFHLGSVQDLINEVDKKIAAAGGIEPEHKVIYPIRYSNRDRYKHPIRFVNRPRVSNDELDKYVQFRKAGNL